MIPAQIRLAAACCRWPQNDPATRAAVAEAAAAVTDWDEMERVLQRHRIIPLACQALRGQPAVPAALQHKLAQWTIRQGQFSLTQARETQRLYSLLRAAGLSPVVLKGAVTGQLAFGAPLLKTSWDIDLFVPKTQALAALEILQKTAGYGHQRAGQIPLTQVTQRQGAAMIAHVKDIGLVGPDGLALELHWSLTGNAYLLQDLESGAPLQSVPLMHFGPVETFCDDLLFAYLCLHGALHGWGRLKWLAEVNALWVGYGPEEQKARLRAAHEVGALTAVSEALQLCQMFFDTAIPAEVGDAPLPSVARARIRLIESPYPPESQNPWLKAKAALRDMGAQAQYQAADQRVFARQFRALQNVMISGADVIALPLPKRFWWIYWVLRGPTFLARAVRYRWFGPKTGSKSELKTPRARPFKAPDNP